MDFKRDESLQKRKNTGYSDTARIMRRALGVTAMRGSDFDPDGSYTGVCDNIYEKPVQDADDFEKSRGKLQKVAKNFILGG